MPTELFATGLPVVLAGDYNVVPEPRDIYATRSYDDNALVQPESRAGLPAASRAGLDAMRCASASRRRPSIRSGTIAGTAGSAMPGMRLDHILLSQEPAHKLGAAGVDTEVRGLENASDHAPAWAEINL